MTIRKSFTNTAFIGAVLFLLMFSILLPFCSLAEEVNTNTKTIIAAQGGASGQLADTLPGLVLAAQSPPDYIEIDVIASRDDKLLVYNDINLCSGTNAAEKFPEKVEEDKRCLSTDFNLDEIRLLRRTSLNGFNPVNELSLGIATLDEYLGLARHLEQVGNKKIALAPNLIHPEIHRAAGIDLSALCLQLLNKFGYSSVEDGILLQSEDADELQRIKRELLPQMMIDIPLVQRIKQKQEVEEGSEEATTSPLYDNSWMFTRIGARMLSSYAAGIAIDTALLHDEAGNVLHEEFIENIRTLAIPLYGYNISDSPETLPQFIQDINSLYNYYLITLNLDGIIINSYKQARQFLLDRDETAKKQALPIFPLKPIQ